MAMLTLKRSGGLETREATPLMTKRGGGEGGKPDPTKEPTPGIKVTRISISRHTKINRVIPEWGIQRPKTGIFV